MTGGVLVGEAFSLQPPRCLSTVAAETAPRPAKVLAMAFRRSCLPEVGGSWADRRPGLSAVGPALRGVGVFFLQGRHRRIGDFLIGKPFRLDPDLRHGAGQLACAS